MKITKGKIKNRRILELFRNGKKGFNNRKIKNEERNEKSCWVQQAIYIYEHMIISL